MEEANICGINHLDADTRLPPRKRLLAGLKKQNCDCASPSSPSLSSISSDFSTRLHDLLSSNLMSSHLSPEEIVEASRSAALAAAKFADAAKVTAVEKAAVASKAVAAAKSALELVASVSAKTTHKERRLRKNKSKKHVPVNLLYKKRRQVENCETDEELARRLHRAMNSSPRISKGSVGSDRKIYNHRKHKKQPNLEKTRDSYGVIVWDGNPPSICDSYAEAGNMDCGGLIPEMENMDKVDEKALECAKADCIEMDHFPAAGEAEAGYLKDKYWQALEDTGAIGRKRGRIRQKKLPLSLCTIRDLENSKEEPESRGFPLMEEPKVECTVRSTPLISVKPTTEGEVSVEGVSIWKIKQYNAPQCFAESKTLHTCSNPTVTTGSTTIDIDQ